MNMSDTDMLYMGGLQRRLEKAEAENAELKRLLKAAVEDMSEKNFCAKVCKRDNFACRVSDTCDFKWRHADEALALIGGGRDVFATDINVSDKGGAENEEQ